MFHFRAADCVEVAIITDLGTHLLPIEARSRRTISPSATEANERWWVRVLPWDLTAQHEGLL